MYVVRIATSRRRRRRRRRLVRGNEVEPQESVVGAGLPPSPLSSVCAPVLLSCRLGSARVLAAVHPGAALPLHRRPQPGAGVDLVHGCQRGAGVLRPVCRGEQAPTAATGVAAAEAAAVGGGLPEPCLPSLVCPVIAVRCARPTGRQTDRPPRPCACLLAAAGRPQPVRPPQLGAALHPDELCPFVAHAVQNQLVLRALVGSAHALGQRLHHGEGGGSGGGEVPFAVRCGAVRCGA